MKNLYPKLSAWFLLSFLIWLTCCGKSNSNEPVSSSKDGDHPAASPSKGNRDEEAPGSSRSAGKRVGGTVFPKKVGDGGPPATGELSLAMDGELVSGRFNLNKNTYSVRGRLESGNLRLWILETGAQTSKRGVMEGTIRDGAYVGTFSISGNGGTPRLSGTFKTTSAL